MENKKNNDSGILAPCVLMNFSINKGINFPVVKLLMQWPRSLLVRNTDTAQMQDCLELDDFGD